MRTLRRGGARWAVALASGALLPVYFLLDGLVADVLWNVVVAAQLLLAFSTKLMSMISS